MKMTKRKAIKQVESKKLVNLNLKEINNKINLNQIQIQNLRHKPQNKALVIRNKAIMRKKKKVIKILVKIKLQVMKRIN